MKKPIPFGKYYLLDRINAGGMAEVFRAKAFGVEGFERIVAVKRILPSIAEDTDFITMFVDEAKIAVQLNHANIAQIFDLGKVGESYFIALEYVHGKDLRALFELSRSRGEPIPIELACYVIMKTCEGLDYAHNKRGASGGDLALVHRDISPQNILISFDGEIKLIDFGIARAAGKAGRTRTGIFKGKFGYLSPEQVQAEEIDRRSDIYGVGIVLYELLTGERLFGADTEFATIEKVKAGEIPPPRARNSRIDEALEAIVLKALARDVRDRYQTAMELHDELRRFLLARGEPFARRELSAWMRQRFPAEAAGNQEAAFDLHDLEALASENTGVAATSEPPEPIAVNRDSRDGPQSGKRNKQGTMLGMPAVAPSPEAAGAGRGRTAPPPPPRSGGGPASVPPRPPSAAPGQGRSVPPPPPRTLPPGAMKQPTVPPPASPSAPPTSSQTFRSAPPPSNTIPSMGMRVPSSPPPGASRSVPPPPGPGYASSPPPSGGAATALARTEGAASSAVLSMDWDDEELSTQIYDRPEDQVGGYPAVAGGYEEMPASSTPAPAMVPTYVPPGMDGPGAGYAASETASVPAGQPPAGSRAAQVTQPIVTQQASTDKNRSLLYTGMGVAALALLSLILYVFLSKTEPGVVQLTTHPADAEVLFDGNKVGNASPFLVTGVAPGERHTLEVRKQGYRSWSQEVEVTPGQTLSFPVTLQPSSDAPEGAGQRVTGSFSLESQPPGAKVFLDGQELGGVTPLRVGNLVPRAYQVRIQLDGFREQTVTAEVRPGADQSLPRVVLEPEQVLVRVTSEPPGADAFVSRGSERRVLGRTPVDVTLENNGKPWVLEVEKSGFERYEQTLAPNGTKEIAVRATLRREFRAASQAPASARSSEPAAKRSADPAPASRGTGTLRINSRPWSQVYVNGKLVGNTPQMNVSLPAGTHKITLVNPDFRLRKNVSVTIKAGETQTQIVSLQ